MIGIPLQTEQFVKTAQSADFAKMGGSRLVYQANYPYQAFSLNKDLTWKLAVTVDEYENGLPKKITKAGFWIPQVYTWDAARRVKQKNFGSLNTYVDYHSTSNLPSYVIDENGFKSTFIYDGLMRLKESKSYFADNSLRSTTTNGYVFGGADNPACNAVTSSVKFEGIADPLSTTQLFDGLGRATQGVKISYGPNKEHIKSAATYDNLGRQTRSYQPFIASNTTCAEAIPSGTLFVQTKYEDSPLGRPIKQTAEDGTFITTEYAANTSNEVLKFVVTNGANDAVASAAGFYDPNALYKTIVTNENGTASPNGNLNKTHIFKDKLGRVVLTRKFVDNTEGGKWIPTTFMTITAIS